MGHCAPNPGSPVQVVSTDSAGILAFLWSGCLPICKANSDSLSYPDQHIGGFTATGIAPDLHRVPLHEDVTKHPHYRNLAAKIGLYFHILALFAKKF